MSRYQEVERKSAVLLALMVGLIWELLTFPLLGVLDGPKVIAGSPHASADH
jgi:hypothetical protein